MEHTGFHNLEKTFSNPAEEIAFLRGEVMKKERELRERGENPLKETIIQEKITQYANTPASEALNPSHGMSQQNIDAIVLDLSPEAHDATMSELLGLLQEKGIKNSLDIVAKMGNPHLEDDFHRFLVQYIKSGMPVDGLKEKTPIAKALKMSLFEVVLPEAEKEEQKKPLKEIISSMEQFLAGMLSVSHADETSTDYCTVELAVSNHSSEFVFYVSVPDTKKSLFEKQILSIFHGARITEKKDDYNIFNEKGVSLGSIGEYEKSGAYSIKTYDQFDYDPLNILLNSFSKIKRDGEGAAIQLVFKPAGDRYFKKYSDAINQIKKGVKAKEATDIPESLGDHFMSIAKSLAKTSSKKDDGEKQVDTMAIEHIQKKISSPIVMTNIRLIASAEDEASASLILHDIESAFNQFEDTQGNKITFKRQKKSGQIDLFKNFSFRLFDDASILPMNLKEVSSVLHFPATISHTAPQLKTARAVTAPAPLDLPTAGILLGVNNHRNIKTDIHMSPEDRLRHFYVIGQTGTGKTSFLKNMIVQDIKNGDGVCFIDPHGSDVQDILAQIPKNRYEDVIYFDPAYTDRPMALNMLEFDARYPEQKTFVVNEMLSIFNKLFDMKTAGGPMFEQYFRNAVLLVLEDPESGSTLLDVSRVLSQKEFRQMKLARCKNPIVTQFWKEVAEKAGGEASLQNIVPYIVSKFDNFLSNDIMRPVIAQEKSTFNFREIMDSKKILLVNLSKGRLGDINANLIGLILVGKILMAALSRVDMLGKDFPPFYLYIDEFQNITTDSISTILSEARKYKLSLNIAHQFIAQLQEGIRDSVFGNVGSIAAFRVGAEDAEYLEKQFSPVFTAKDIMNVENFNAYVKMLSRGIPIKPFSMALVPPEKGTVKSLDSLKMLSYLKYGRDRADVEAEILKKYQKPQPQV